MSQWLALPSVMSALHVQASKGMTYKKTATSLLPLYSELIKVRELCFPYEHADSLMPA